MKTLYQIKYKIVNGNTVNEGIRVVEQPVREYLETLRGNNRDASYIYVELLDEVQRTASSSEVMAGGGLIIMP